MTRSANGSPLLLEREISYRRNNGLAPRWRCAKLRHAACVEDMGYRISRGPRSLLAAQVGPELMDRHLGPPSTSFGGRADGQSM